MRKNYSEDNSGRYSPQKSNSLSSNTAEKSTDITDKVKRSIIVMPTYNEADNIEELVTRIFKTYPQIRILIIDDNSPDGTGKIVDVLAEKNKNILVIHRNKKMGLGTAYIEGFKMALTYDLDYIFEMDADFSHDIIYIADMLSAMDNADLVIGSRYINGVRVDGWRFRRLILSKIANMFASYILVKPIWDITSGYRCYNRQLLNALISDKIQSDGYVFQIEMAVHSLNKGFRVVEVPIIFKERKHGYSKISRHIVWEAIWLIMKLRAPLPKIIRHLKYLFKD